MDKESYIEMLDMVKSKPWLYNFVTKGGKALTFVSYIVYPVLIFLVFYLKKENPWAVIVVPAVGFIVLSAFRYYIDAPRPYEVFETQPLVVKNTKGKSYPSRHVFSAFIIACAAWWYFPILGVALAVCGALLAVARVLSGVHFRRDVIAGAASGIVFGFTGFIIML